MIPWQVSIRDESNDHFCGGTVLDSETVLTAAHCFVEGESTSGFTIMAGSKNRENGGQVCW